MDNCYVDFISKLERDNRFKDLNGVCKYLNRKVYLDGQELEENKLEIVFQGYFGNDLFSETIAFSIISIAEKNIVKVIIHIINSEFIINILDYKRISNILYNEILKKVNKINLKNVL